jgi:hypothetical protein
MLPVMSKTLWLSGWLRSRDPRVPSAGWSCASGDRYRVRVSDDGSTVGLWRR